MDVSRVNGAGYQPPPPPPPTSGSSQPVASPETNVSVPAPRIIPSGDAVVSDSFDTRAEGRAEGTDALRRAVGAINTTMASYSRHMSVTFHEATGRNSVTVYDSETNEAVREIPPQRVLDAHANLLELAGLFVDSRG
jgi:flagellar protein FlaG